jgi:hypothetical protein
MKAFRRASAACLGFIFVFFYAWQYVANPRAQEGRSAKILGQLSRTIFGERCLETYKISNRRDAVAYARTIWRVEEFKLALLGDDYVAKTIFESALFRDGGDQDRDLSGAGWLAGRSGVDSWHVNYSASDPVVAAYLSAEFTDCGRVTNSARKIFSQKG